MKEEDLEFLEDIINDSHWLFYGDLDLVPFLKKVFTRELRDWGFEALPEEFALPYWLVVSELIALNLAEYGTSPRGAWLTEKGERFKKLVMENENAIEEANDYVFKKYNS